RLARQDDAVVPQPRGGVVRIALFLVLRADRRLEGVFVRRAPFPAVGLDVVALDGRQHRGGLLAAHHRDAGVRPGEQETRAVGAAAHAAAAGAERAHDDTR